MNEAQRELAKVALRRLVRRFSVVHKANPALAEMVMAELALRSGYFAAHRAGIEAATAHAKEGAEAAIAAYEVAAEPGIERAVRSVVPKMYRLGKRLAASRSKEPVEHPPNEQLAKADGEEDDDHDEIAALILLFLLGARSQLRRVLLPRLTDVIEATPVEERGAVLREQLGADLPWRGQTRQLYNDTAAAVATSARAVSAVRELERGGAKKLRWVTAEDERVCPRCSSMEGVEIDIEHASGLINRMLRADSYDAFVNIRPWHSEPDFLRIFRTAIGGGSASKSLGEAGLLIPPIHGRCRCVLV